MATGQSVFYVFDERGNASRRLDAAGNVLSSYAADAFGGVLSVPLGAVGGVVHVAPDGSHMHPQVLGGGKPAIGAGTLTVGPNGGITSFDNISGTFQFGGDTLAGVASAMQRQGMKVHPGAMKVFRW